MLVSIISITSIVSIISITSIVSSVILLVLLVLYCQHFKLCDTVNKGKKKVLGNIQHRLLVNVSLVDQNH